jgi:hypothetical protein
MKKVPKEELDYAYPKYAASRTSISARRQATLPTNRQKIEISPHLIGKLNDIKIPLTRE